MLPRILTSFLEFVNRLQPEVFCLLKNSADYAPHEISRIVSTDGGELPNPLQSSAGTPGGLFASDAKVIGTTGFKPNGSGSVRHVLFAQPFEAARSWKVPIFPCASGIWQWH